MGETQGRGVVPPFQSSALASLKPGAAFVPHWPRALLYRPVGATGQVLLKQCSGAGFHPA